MLLKNEKIILIISLLAAILLMNIGYAEVTNVNISSNTAYISNDFNVKFSNISIVKSVGANILDTESLISSDKKSIDLNNIELAYPGAGIEFSVDILNNGVIPAKINSIDVTGLDYNSIIQVEICNNVKDMILNPNDVQNIHIIVKWDVNSKTIIEEKQNFNININYVQSL